jgi:hypothetical protein
MNTEKINLRKQDLTVGEVVPWQVFSDDGRLMLNEGQPVSSDDQINVLLSHGAWRKEDIVDVIELEEIGLAIGETSILERLDAFKTRFNDFLSTVAQGNDGSPMPELSAI